MTRIRKGKIKEDKLKAVNEVLNGKSSNEVAKKYDEFGEVADDYLENDK